MSMVMAFSSCSKDDEPKVENTTFSYELKNELRIHSYRDKNYVDTAKVVTVIEFNDNNDILESHIIKPLKSGIKSEFIANELSTKVRVLYEFSDTYSFEVLQQEKTYFRWIEKVYFLTKNKNTEIYDDISIYYTSERP